MFRRFRRSPNTRCLFDFGPLTLSFCSAFFADGGHRWPDVRIILRDRWLAGRSCTGGRALRHRSVTLPLPYVRFHRSHRLNRAFSRLYYRLWGTQYR